MDSVEVLDLGVISALSPSISTGVSPCKSIPKKSSKVVSTSRIIVNYIYNENGSINNIDIVGEFPASIDTRKHYSYDASGRINEIRMSQLQRGRESQSYPLQLLA
jgi:hypothetical protein